MKRSGKCVKCGNTNLLSITAISSDKNNPDQIASLLEMSDRLAGTSLGVSKGSIEMITCSQCGYSELYHKNPGDIIVDGKLVKMLN